MGNPKRNKNIEIHYVTDNEIIKRRIPKCQKKKVKNQGLD